MISEKHQYFGVQIAKYLSDWCKFEVGESVAPINIVVPLLSQNVFCEKSEAKIKKP